ncbi:endonuclease/exonuclease/phosphatase family domain-containing protein 1-like [Patiria miniata]|uniref:Endonuclease/exonuclease/phosphatase domain-containing protein n=1 Tax=Patiria miniata TaxID=46514 RepID=A0A914AWI2_PATMI|nr:endonuclease/exonuclease/phosphatase family domain-containing protein 1-like [Patiria miniata]XP_038068062.1 endonuclease/exonuclease/phosphatase family domain-containing protein 1-like [Patiria miniata]XP_038068063.1 endonuclease/exonuclease/phosphatase family domain-containing protein 1-like [Patiria miniata]
MGMVSSCCGRRPNKSRLHSHSERADYKKGKRLVSASYNAQEFDMTFDQMNINEASEEELMTLQGVTRNIAKNIISYRHHIGGFRKPEDLVLVSGVGATKLEAFRTEVYCGPYAVTSHIDKVPSRTSYHRVNSKVSFENKVNVNTAAVPALAKVLSIGHEFAEIIVRHREEHGPFTLITDVGKIPEIGSYRFELMRNHLTVGESSESTVSTPSFLEMRKLLHSEEEDVSGSEVQTSKSSRNSPRKLASQATQTDQIFLPLIMTSVEAWARPVVDLPSDNDSNKRSTVRTGTWNLQQFSREKAENLGVKEVICMTILENRLSVLAVQEIADKDALAVICAELNDPTLAVVRNWPSPRGIWKCVTSESAGRMFQGVEYNGFLWNTSDGVTLTESALLQSPKRSTNGKRHFARKPFLGYFKLQELDVVLISVHLKFPGLNNNSRDKLEEEISQLSLLNDALEEQLPDENDILIVGDFNSAPSAPDFKALTTAGFSYAIAEDRFTNISTKNPEGSHCYDNAWFSKSLHKIHTGESHVVREGLTHPLIPDNWSWGGVVSDHCPLWVEFYSDCDLDEGGPGILAQLSKVRILAK